MSGTASGESIHDGFGHEHGSVEDVRQCYKTHFEPLASWGPPSVTHLPPEDSESTPAPASEPESTEPYCTKCGGICHRGKYRGKEIWVHANGMFLAYDPERHDCNAFMRLPEGQKEEEVPVPDPEPSIIESLLPQIRDGFYAAKLEEGDKLRFFRVKKWKHGRLVGHRTVDTQHGPDYRHAWVQWASGGFSTFQANMENHFLLVVANQREAARTYARELRRCCVCNKELTDPRSRYYGIGPDCETRYQEFIDEVDAEAEATYEELLRAGKIETT